MTLKLEVGKTYVDKDRILNEVLAKINGFYLVKCIQFNNISFRWYDESGYYMCDGSTNPTDYQRNKTHIYNLIAEHKEQAVHEKDGEIHAIVCDELWEDEKVTFTGGVLKKREKITYTEGE